MKNVSISLARAQQLILHGAGLGSAAQFGKGKEAAFKYLDHLGFLQIDTNFVIERAHHHSIWSRVPDYKTDWLYELQDERRIFEFWTFASGFIPMTEYRFSFPVKEALMTRRKSVTPKETYLMNQILDRISREGPLMARDFENDRVKKSSGWWDWRPSKIALERLHFGGQLITSRRKDFQKVYDLPENIISSDIDLTPPTQEEFARYMILRSLRVWGVGDVRDIAFRARYVKGHAIKSELQKLVEEGVVLAVEVEGIKSPQLYMLAEYEKLKIKSSNNVFILSPFDVFNVRRQRLKLFFDFDYMVECFVPEKKRKYGYFALPVLVGNTFIARMDAKADRKEQVLIINNLHFEGVRTTTFDKKKLAKKIYDFALFNGCSTVLLTRSNDKKIQQQLNAELDALTKQPRRRIRNIS